MIGTLRFIGILNAAVWFGAAFFAMFGAGRAAYSQEMSNLVGPKFYPYYSGAIAQIMMERLFHWQLACSTVALLHLVAEWLYLGKTPQRLWLGLLAALILANVANGFVFEPRLKTLHTERFATNTPSDRRYVSSQAYATWQRMSYAFNLLVVAGLGAYLWRAANPPDPTRFTSASKFRG